MTVISYFFIEIITMDIPLEDQPCPHCFKSRNGKIWNKKEMNNMKELISDQFVNISKKDF